MNKQIRMVYHDSAIGEDLTDNITVADITSSAIIQHFLDAADEVDTPRPHIECRWLEQSGSQYAFVLHCDDPLFGYHFITGVIYTEFI